MNTLNITAPMIAAIVSTMGIFNGTGRLVFATISDMTNRVGIYITISIISIVMVIMCIILNNPTVVIVTLILISATYGAGFSCLPPMLSNIYGMKNISKIHGLVLSAWGVAGLIGNKISATIYDMTQSYNIVYIVLFTMYLIELLLSYILYKKTFKKH